MPFMLRTISIVAAGAAFVATPALAQPYGHHHRPHYRYAPAQPNGAGEPYGYRNAPYPQAYGGYYGSGNYSYGANYGHGYASGFGYAGGWEGAAVARLTAKAYTEPGLTLELAPDAKLTATGGPVGGVPGFSAN